MAQEIVGIKIQVDGKEKVLGSMGEIRKELKAASFDVLRFTEQFGATSKEAAEAAKRVALLKDAIGDSKTLIAAFNPDAKFKALTASLSGVAGGFAAVQGALGLMGVEGENVQKTLLKVQSAMAISQGLQTLGESIDSFRQLGAVIKSTTVFQAAYNFIMGQKVAITEADVVATVEETAALEAEAIATTEVAVATTGATIAMRLFRAALVATGIGAIVVLLGFLIEGLISLTGSTKEAKDEQEKLNKVIETQNEILADNERKIKNAGQLRISELKKNGAKEAEIYKEQRTNDQLLLDEYLQDYRKKYAIFEDDKKKNANATDKDILANSEKFRKAAIESSDKYEQQKIKLQVDANNEIARVNKDATEKAKKAKDDADKKKKEKDDAELEAQKQLVKLKGEVEVLGIVDEYKAKRVAVDNQLLADINQINANEKLKAETKQALVIAMGDKANADIAKINKEQADEQAKKDKEALLKKQEGERGIRELGIQAEIELLDKKNAKIDGDYDEDLRRLELKKDLLNEQMAVELENTELTEFQKTEIRKKYADARAKVAEDEVATEKAKQQAKIDLNNAYLDLANQFGGFLKEIAGKNKALAIAGVVVEQAASIGRIISNTGVANAKAVTASPLTFGQPWVAVNSISAGLSIASSIAAGVKAVQQINAAQPGGAGGSAISSASAPIAPAAAIQNTRTELSAQSINDLGSATNRAYVVESDVTNSQERIKRINRAARLA